MMCEGMNIVFNDRKGKLSYDMKESFIVILKYIFMRSFSVQ